MSLFGSIQMAGAALRANDIALQVVGQNISNANTPGYIREDVVLAPAPAQRNGGLILGLGVTVEAVVQKIDLFLEQRLRGAVSDKSATETTQQSYAQLEGLLGELNNSDLSTVMNTFFGSIAEILNQPQDRSVRNQAVLEGESLTENIKHMATSAQSLSDNIDKRIADIGTEINQLIDQIQKLNIRITETEGGDISASDAVGLRDERLQALEGLAKLIDIRVVEQPSGGVTVYTGGDFLVFEGQSRHVETVIDAETGKSNIHLAETDAPLNPSSGELRGLVASRDEAIGGFLDSLNSFTSTLIFEFNKIFASGQGLSGFTEVAGQNAVLDRTKALNQAGLAFSPSNGSFQVLISNKKTGITQTTNVRVNLNGLDHQTSLTDLAASLDGVDGLQAEVTSNNTLLLKAESTDQEFAFANDTSHVLAALGINTFFSGSTAQDVGINRVVRAEPSLFAASRDGIGADTKMAVDLAAFLDRPLDTHNGDSIGVLYNRLAAEVTQGSSAAQAEAQGADTFEQTLRGQKLATSGVNIDEEALQMISYQRAYQAAARYISVLSDLFDVLVKI